MGVFGVKESKSGVRITICGNQEWWKVGVGSERSGGLTLPKDPLLVIYLYEASKLKPFSSSKSWWKRECLGALCHALLHPKLCVNIQKYQKQEKWEKILRHKPSRNCKNKKSEKNWGENIFEWKLFFQKQKLFNSPQAAQKSHFQWDIPRTDGHRTDTQTDHGHS